MKNAGVTAILGGLVLLWAATAQAQWHDPNDKGATDTVDMVIGVVPRASSGQLKMRLDLYMFNDSNTVGAAAAGFKWINSNLKMDSARFTPLAFDAFDFARFTYEGNNINLTNTNQRFPFVGARSSSTGVLPDPSKRIWCRYYFSLSSWTVNDSIVLDTNTYSSGVTYKFVDDSLKSYRPWFTGRKVIHDVDYVPPSTIQLSPDTLTFTTVYGDPAPPSQTFAITSTPNPVAFTVTENSPWILKSPALGNTPANITVSINPTGLVIGTYFDSLIVESNNATNSPQVEYVKLNVTPPPPMIKVTPSQLFFSGVVGGANPASKDLIIKNGNPGSTLNWSLSYTQSWLSVTPASGVDSNTAVVSVDITGLPYGTYKDTIVITDPSAVNNPVKIPVFLQMGSNLPVIVADSQYNFFVINLSELILFSRTITIRNGGPGQLDFKATENSPRIKLIIPDTGTTPMQLQVQYKISSAFDGDEFTDTVWINSAQAVNSPYPVVITIHFVLNPAVIGLNTDTIKFTVYECEQPGGAPLPTANLIVQNSGQDDPMNVKLLYSSDFFSVNKDSGVAPVTFKVSALNPDTALGTYYDTIVVAARNAVNNPRSVIVQYNRIAGTQPPLISLTPANLTVPYQENSGPLSLSLNINNPNGGCMPWKLTNKSPWLQPKADTGNVPANVTAIVDAPGYTLGKYYDTASVASSGASNTPVLMPVELRVWKFRCDVNWDGSMDIADITALIAYEFLGSQIAPQPTYLVGDCDCDNKVDIADLTRLIDYLLMGGPVMCGNPY